MEKNSETQETPDKRYKYNKKQQKIIALIPSIKGPLQNSLYGGISNTSPIVTE